MGTDGDVAVWCCSKVVLLSCSAAVLQFKEKKAKAEKI